MPDAPAPAPSPSWWQRWRRSAAVSQTPLAAAPADQRSIIGGYRVERRLGQGASGPVYLAVAPDAAGTPVALKVFAPDPAWSSAERAQQRERFERQAEVLGTLSHPDIVAALGSGTHEGQPWLALELAPGSDLSRYTARARLLPEALVLKLVARVARALAHAHAQGVIHRDLKPANVRVDLAHDRLKLVDFGIARVEDAQVTRTGVTLGTPAYMAPEQLAGAPADAAGDTYALGVMLYELLSGRLPYPASNLGELLRAVSAGDAVPVSHWRDGLPDAVQQLVAQLLQRDPSARPRNLTTLAEALERSAAAMPRPRGS